VDPNRANQLKELLDPLTRLAAQYRCAILASRHPAKPGQNNVKLIHRGANSMAIIGTARLGLFAEDHPTDRTKVLLVQSKSNAGDVGRTQIFSKAEGKFEWVGVSRIRKEDLAGPSHGPDSRLWLGAYFWLEARLEGGLAWNATDIEKEATEEQDLTAMILKRAKKALGVVSRQMTGAAHAGWTWQLPPLPLVHYPSSSTEAYDTTDTTDATDYSDLKSSTYEEDGQEVSEESGASEVSEVSVDGVVIEEPPTPLVDHDCYPQTDAPTPDEDTRAARAARVIQICQEEARAMAVPLPPAPPPCFHCRGVIFWRNAGGEPICARCHPEPKERREG
jgi:hypothetical protein